MRAKTPMGVSPCWTPWASAFVAVTAILWLGSLFRDPRAMVVFGGFFQAATLPVIAAATVYMRYRRTDPRIAPSKLSDLCLWLAFLSITVVAAYAIRDWGLTELWPSISGVSGSK